MSTNLPLGRSRPEGAGGVPRAPPPTPPPGEGGLDGTRPTVPELAPPERSSTRPGFEPVLFTSTDVPGYQPCDGPTGTDIPGYPGWGAPPERLPVDHDSRRGVERGGRSLAPPLAPPGHHA